MAPSGPAVAKTAAIGAAAYLLGLAASPYVVPVDFFSSKWQPHQQLQGLQQDASDAVPAPPTPSSPPTKLPGAKTGEDNLPQKNEEIYKDMVDFGIEGDPFRGVRIVVHRNGEPNPCARQAASGKGESAGLSSVSRALLQSAGAKSTKASKPLDEYTKYDFDALLTHSLAVGEDGEALLEGRGGGCGPTWEDEAAHYLDGAPHLKGVSYSSMVKFCDMGLEKTPIQLDHGKMMPVPHLLSMPCHFHTREGVRLTSVEQLANLARRAKVAQGECTADEETTCSEDPAGDGQKELHLYAVQAARVFIFAPKYVGEIFELPHVSVPDALPVSLEVISLSPRVFDIHNFFNRAESAAIVDKALQETSETHRIKRSSTGASGYNVNSQRTSENGFDTHGKEAQAVKRRCMHVLGFDHYVESLTDGLQVLRYNKTTAYVPHLDWIDDHAKLQEHDFDSAHMGSNRFATILLYMTDLEEGDGGETVFAHGWPANQAEEDRVQFHDAKMALRESGEVEGLLAHDSWEENMVVKCRHRLAVRPHSSRAVLFYSQNPDGTPDSQSLHGGCPVIEGEKWAANLWVWNAPRGGFPGSPKNKHVVEKNKAAGKSPETDAQKKASFSNTQTDERYRNAKLYFQETFWGDLGFGDPALNVNSYEGHQWNVKAGEETLHTFVIDKRPMQQYTV